MVIELHKIDKLVLKDCPSEDFEVALKFIYNQTCLPDDLSLDKVISVGVLADRYLLTGLQTAIFKHLQKKFSTVFALKIYLWVNKYYSERKKSLKQMRQFILDNFNTVFFKGVFH